MGSFDGCRECPSCCDDAVSGSDWGNRHCVVLESERVGEALTSSVFHEGSNAAVMLERWSDVPSVGGMEGPRFAASWIEMDEDLCSRWGQGCCVRTEQLRKLGKLFDYYLDKFNQQTGVFIRHKHRVVKQHCS